MAGPAEELVEKVKDLQRTSHEGKLKWMSYTMATGSGKHDPRYHSSDYIEEFFRLFEADEIEIDPKIRGAPGPIVNNEVFVGHLPQDIDESEIHGYFSEWGEVVKIEYKEGRGFAFITFANEAEIDVLLEHHSDHHIRDQHVDVKRAEDRRKGGKGGKGGSDYGGGKGYGKGGHGGGKGHGKSKGHDSGKGKRGRDEYHDQGPPAKKGKSGGGKGGKSSNQGGGGKGKGGGKSASSNAGGGGGGYKQKVSADDEWWAPPPQASSKGKGSSGKGSSGKGSSKGSGGGGSGYEKFSQHAGGGSHGHNKGSSKGQSKGKSGGKGGKGGKRSSPY